MLILILSLSHFTHSERSSVTKLLVCRVCAPDPGGELTTLPVPILLSFLAVEPQALAFCCFAPDNVPCYLSNLKHHGCLDVLKLPLTPSPKHTV